MKNMGLLIAIALILIIGGGLTMQLITSGSDSLLPVLRNTDNPNGAVDQVVGWKAEQLFLAVGFIMFNLVGIGVTLAGVIWFLDRGIKTSKAEEAAKTQS